MEIIIEEISRGQKLMGRHKFAKQNVRIGRGYQNDLILSDPHVCPDHLDISFDGEKWLATDQGTINGSYFQETKQTHKQQVVNSGDVISIGKSQIRIVFPDHPVPESIRFSVFESFTNHTRKPWFILLNIALFALVCAYGVFLDASKEINSTQILVPTIGMTIVFGLWPALVAIISHLSKHDARFLTQLGICFVFYNVMWLYDLIDSTLSFNSSSHFSVFDILGILPVLLVFSLLWFNCYIGFHFSEKKRLIISVCLTTLLFGGNALISLSKTPDFSPKARYNATLMTPDYLFIEPSSIEDFINDSNKLFAKTAEQAKIKED